MALLFIYFILTLQPDFISSSECNAQNCDPNYGNDISCTQCLPGFYKHFSGYCNKCVLGCRRCKGGQCFNCFYQECVDGTDICDYANCDSLGCSSTNLVTCTGCPDGFYLGEDDMCYRCDNTNCKCSSASGCDECLANNFDINTLCKECIPGIYGDSCELNCISICDDGTCNKESGTYLTECVSGEYFDDSGECKPCPWRCSSCVNSAYCTGCKQHWYWSPTCGYDCTGCMSSCDRNDGCSAGCSEPYYNAYNSDKNGYECIRCPDQCYVCENDTYCISCRDNYWGKTCLYSCNNCDGTCDKDHECTNNCELGYYRQQIETGHECKLCSEYCEQCLDSLTCQVCEVGFYVDDVSNNCVACSINCNDTICPRGTEHVQVDVLLE